MKKVSTFAILILSQLITIGQPTEVKLTASQIVQNAVDTEILSGSFDSVKNCEIYAELITFSGDTLHIATKQIPDKSYTISLLSLGHVNQTTKYNDGKAVIITNDKVQEISDPTQLEELRLRTYPTISLGYQRMNYQFERLEDQKFEAFDCYVVSSRSPLGRISLNYYNKKDRKLLMVIHESGGKTVFVDHTKAANISLPSVIFLMDKNENVSQSFVKRSKINGRIEHEWFELPAVGTFELPNHLKYGTFNYLNVSKPAKIIRVGASQIQNVDGTTKEYKITWTGKNDYLLFRLIDSKLPATNENIEFVKVRVVGWNNSKFLCHYLNSKRESGTCEFQKASD